MIISSDMSEKKLFQLSIITFILLAIIAGQAAFGGTIYVKPGGSGSGSNWLDAYGNLQDALSAARYDDEIWVSAGTYKPSTKVGGSDSRYQTFQMKNSVAIYGGFDGTEDPSTFDLADRYFKANETILSGDLNGDDLSSPGGGVPGENCFEAGPINSGQTSFSTIGSTTDGPGDCAINQDIWYVYTAEVSGNLTVSLCGSDYDTYLSVYEGATCPPTILLGCNDDYCGIGAGSQVSISVIQGNDYLIRVGGWSTSTGTGIITISPAVYDDNSYHVFYHPMGTNLDATAILDGFTITAGNADRSGKHGSGGGMNNYISSSPTVRNCMFIGNSAIYGGGMYNIFGSNPTLSNCAFIDNSAEYGGGMDNHRSSPTVSNCTFSENSASLYGGGMDNFDLSIVTVSNCIFWGNSAVSGGNEIALHLSSIIDVDYCDVEGSLAGIYDDVSGNIINWGIGNIDVDPNFVDPSNYDFHLKSEGWCWDPNAYRSCDLTDDGFVNLADFVGFANSWLIIAPSNPADINKDQRVDIDDLYLFAQQYLTDGYVTDHWVHDDVTSRCIDAGNPGLPLGDELLSIPGDPNNDYGENIRINMGVYGGTAKAGIPPHDWTLLADLTNDGIINLEDFAGQAMDWLITAEAQPGDVDRDGTVGASDLAILVINWLEETSWALP